LVAGAGGPQIRTSQRCAEGGSAALLLSLISDKRQSVRHLSQYCQGEKGPGDGETQGRKPLQTGQKASKAGFRPQSSADKETCPQVDRQDLIDQKARPETDRAETGS